MKLWDRISRLFGPKTPKPDSNLVIIYGPNVFSIVSWLKKDYSFTRDKSEPSHITNMHVAVFLDTKTRLFKLISVVSTRGYTCRKLYVAVFSGSKLEENKRKLAKALNLENMV